MAADRFNSMDKSLSHFGHSKEARNAIYKIIAAILHLGNVSIQEKEDSNEGEIRKESKCSLEYAARLMQVKTDQLKQVLLTRCFHVNDINEMWVSEL